MSFQQYLNNPLVSSVIFLYIFFFLLMLSLGFKNIRIFSKYFSDLLIDTPNFLDNTIYYVWILFDKYKILMPKK